MDVLKNLKNTRLNNAKMLVISSPVDILTHLAIQEDLLPPSRIFGLGTVLDTCRLSSLIGEKFNVNPCDVKALVLGEHGESMVPIWSSATINGIPLHCIKGYNPRTGQELFERTRQSADELARLKGGAGRAVAVTARTIVEAIDCDNGALLPVSSFQKGSLGIRDICLSLPARIGKEGILEIVEPAVSNEEKQALQQSAEILKKALSQVTTATRPS
jgi:L-lactate dehydrogenase